MEHKKIKVKGGIVHYWIDRAEKSQSCIVFSHGVTADHTMFEKQIACFCGKYTILLWDIPMYGLSRPYVGFSYQDTAEILHEILNKEKIETVFLVGMSMGGYPCQHFAALYPHMVKGFVALDTTPLGMPYYSMCLSALLSKYTNWNLQR